MPQIKVRGINENDICKISEKMVDELVEAVKCPRDYFEIECIKSVAIRDGKIADVYPFVEVAWFDRGQEVQDTVAKIITDNIRENLNIESMDLAFTVFPLAITSTVDLNSAAFLTNIPAGLVCNPLAFFMLTFFSICKTSKIYF